LDSLVPRLYPLLRHNLVSVRISSIQTFDELINGPNSKWIEPILSDLLRYVFQNIILERNDSIISESFKTWNSLMKVVSGEKLLTALNDVVRYWIYLLATPFGCQFDISLMLLPESIRYSLQNGFHFFINF
jgi:TATA-binding protein-associated factor